MAEKVLFSVFMAPACKSLLKRSKLAQKKRVWLLGAISALQNCFKSTNSVLFREAAINGDFINLEEHTDSVTVRLLSA